MRLRTLELEVDGLPPELDGLRIAHLSDFHLGLPSLGERATERAVDWVAKRRPDLVCVTGDLVYDATAFDDKRIPVGWNSTYLGAAYAARV